MKIVMRFEGGAELAQALDRLSIPLSRKVMREALIEGGEPMRAAASRYAPYEPGPPDLKENIGIAAVRARDNDIATVAIGPTRDFAYGLPQELGTIYHRAQPFMRPAFDSTQNVVLGKIGQALWRELAARGIGRSVSMPSAVQSLGRFT